MKLTDKVRLNKSLNIAMIIAMFLIPFAFLFNSFDAKIALTTIYLVGVIAYMSKAISVKRIRDRNAKDEKEIWKNIKSDMLKELAFDILSGLIIAFILCKFLISDPTLANSWDGYAPTTAKAVWFGAVTAIAGAAAGLSIETFIRFLLFWAKKNIKQLIKKTFKAFKNFMKSIFSATKVVMNFIKKVIANIQESLNKNLSEELSISQQIYDIKNTELITLNKKASVPPLF